MRGATLRQLRAFSLVARHRSFVQAAAELHLTPSAVSLQIKELEQVAQLSLFDRNGKSVSLTRAGEALLVDVQRALQALQHADETLARMRGRESDAVSVGMVSSAKYFLPKLLAQFRKLHRDIELRLSVGNREQLIEQLHRGQVDLAVMGEPPLELAAHGEPFAAQPLGIVAAPNHALTRERDIPVAALAQQEFIVRERGSGTRAAMERFFRAAHIEPPRLMEMTSNGIIKQAVMANMGLGFISLHAAGLELRDQLLVAIDVVGLPQLRRWYVVNSDCGPLADAAELLRLYILDHGAGAIAPPFGGLAAGNKAWQAAAELID
jgi:DNA-binding transcriptional LysR family regulator